MKICKGCGIDIEHKKSRSYCTEKCEIKYREALKGIKRKKISARKQKASGDRNIIDVSWLNF